MWLQTAIVVFLSAATATAVPADARAANCDVVKDVVNHFTKYTRSASSFCSAYLETSTTTTVRVVFTATTTQKTTPETELTTATVTSTSTIIVSTVYTTRVNTFRRRNDAIAPTAIPVIEDEGLHARDGKVPYPFWLAPIFPRALVSTACSCYIAPPPKKTVTATKITGTTTRTAEATAPTPFTTTTTTTTVTTKTTLSNAPTIGIYCGVIGCINDFVTFELAGAGSANVQKCKSQTGQQCSNCNYFEIAPGFCGKASGDLENLYAQGTSDACSDRRIYDVRCEV